MFNADIEDIDDSPKSAFQEILAHERPRRLAEQYYSTDKYFLGLDLGEIKDFSALSIIKRTPDNDRLQLISLKRFALGTSYPVIAQQIKSIMYRPALRKGNSLLIADATGVGLPVIEMIRQKGLRCLGVWITGGEKAIRKRDSRGKLADDYRIPKLSLISNLLVKMQDSKLEISGRLRLGPTLIEELQNFEKKISLTSGHESFGAWREGTYDDLTLATSLSTWFASTNTNPMPFRPRVMISGSRPYMRL